MHLSLYLLKPNKVVLCGNWVKVGHHLQNGSHSTIIYLDLFVNRLIWRTQNKFSMLEYLKLNIWILLRISLLKLLKFDRNSIFYCSTLCSFRKVSLQQIPNYSIFMLVHKFQWCTPKIIDVYIVSNEPLISLPCNYIFHPWNLRDEL